MDLHYLNLPDKGLFTWFGNLFVETANSLKGISLSKDIPPRERKLDFNKPEFLKTFTVLFQSISTLSDGIEVVGNNKAETVSAMPAIETLIRACLENYALFHFIYLDSQDAETIRYRFWSWYREGLRVRP